MVFYILIYSFKICRFITSSDKSGDKSTLQGASFTIPICLTKLSYYLKGFLKISFCSGTDGHHHIRATHTKFYS